jgi:hypothetical protein
VAQTAQLTRNISRLRLNRNITGKIPIDNRDRIRTDPRSLIAASARSHCRHFADKSTGNGPIAYQT